MFLRIQVPGSAWKWRLLFLLLLVFQFSGAQQTDSLLVDFDKAVLRKGDTLNIDIQLPNYARVAKAATVQVVAEYLKTGRRWYFRYPLINGYAGVSLIADSSLPSGAYAFNVLLRRSFFQLTGRIKNGGRGEQVLNYVMIAKGRQSVVDVLKTDEQQQFSIRNLLFQDTAFFIFSKPGKKKNDLELDISTPLDSSFTPTATVTRMLSVGDVVSSGIPARDTAGYFFQPDTSRYKIIMPEVVLTSRSKRRMEEFDREITTGSFSGQDAIMLDGLGSDEIANAPDLFLYLTMKVGGLRMETDESTGNRRFTWRNLPVDMFLNEIRLDPEVPFWINPMDIALIKIFRPGTQLFADGAAGGSIAIYTKTGVYRDDNSRRYSFYVPGFTPAESHWR